MRKRAAYKILARGADFLTLQSEATCRHGYGYRMEKHFALQDNKLVIRYVMTNIGEKPLRSRQYCHNFTLIDDVPAAPGAYTTTFPFAICPASEGNGRGQWKNGTVTTSGEVVFMPFANENLTVSDNFAEVRQTSTGLGMRCTGDFVPEKVVYFSTARTVCPEIFKALNIAPGQSDAWTRTIEFF